MLSARSRRYVACYRPVERTGPTATRDYTAEELLHPDVRAVFLEKGAAFKIRPYSTRDLMASFEAAYGDGPFFEPVAVRCAHEIATVGNRCVFAPRGTIASEREFMAAAARASASEAVTTKMFASALERTDRMRAFVAAFVWECHGVVEPRLDSFIARAIVRRLRWSISGLVELPPWHGSARRIVPWQADWTRVTVMFGDVRSIEDAVMVAADLARGWNAQNSLYRLEPAPDPALAHALAVRASHDLQRASSALHAGRHEEALELARAAVAHLERSCSAARHPARS